MPPALSSRAAPRRTAQPERDSRYRSVTDKLARDARQLKQHPNAARKIRDAASSAKAPANERVAGAKSKQVDETNEAPTPKPQPSSFKAALRAQLEQVMPQTLGQTENFLNAEQSGSLKSSLSSNVAQQQERATGPLDQATKKPPDPGAVPATQSTPLPKEAAAAAPKVDGAAAMPAPLPAADISLQQSKQDATQQLDSNKIKPATLQHANDPRFSAVASAKAQVNAHADSAPSKYRSREAQVLGAAGAQADANAAQSSKLLIGSRGRGQAKVLTRQQQHAAKEEAERKKVADTIEGIFGRTKKRVETMLDGLDMEVSTLFDAGVEAALATMKKFVDDKLFAYKLERYLSIPIVGLARWVRDQALGLPDEVNAFYQQGRRVFQTSMDACIDKVANLVETRLAQAKSEVARGQAEIKAYVSSLPANLRAAGQAAERGVNERFVELEQGIEDKKNELASSLADKYKEAFEKADSALKEMQDENKGLLQRFAEKLAEVVKALVEFKAKLIGILKKGQETIQLILDDPIQFLSNLVAAVKGGFNAFVSNIWTHLKAGFMAWLFGALATMGVNIPRDLSLPSILKLVLDVLGITYDRMRAKAVQLLGERAVALIEKAAEYINALVTGGPAKLWEQVKEDLSNLKEMVIDAIQSWLIDTVVKQAVAKVVTFFNPAGAIIQAVLAIYNLVMFVVEKAQQIVALIEAVVNSVHAIATGAIGGAISWIERSLASAIPVVIGFLARLLGLSGVTKKIEEFIRKIQSKVDKAIDKAIAKVITIVRRMFGALRAGATKLLQWWKKTAAVSGGGETHTLKFEGSGASAELFMFSRKKKPRSFILPFLEATPAKPKAQQALALDAEVADLQAKLLGAGDDTAKSTALSAQLDQKLTDFARLLGELLDTSADEGSKARPLMIDYPKRRASAYAPIYVGPKVGDGNRIDQKVLKGLTGQPSAKVATLLAQYPRFKKRIGAWDGVVQVFSPLSATTLDGKAVGLSSEFASLAPGKIVEFNSEAGTGGGSKVNAIFRPYGFSPSDERLDGDHVLERQLGGPDDSTNLWPLARSENRSSGSLVKDLTTKLGGADVSVKEARRKRKNGQLFLLIRSTR